MRANRLVESEHEQFANVLSAMARLMAAAPNDFLTGRRAVMTDWRARHSMASEGGALRTAKERFFSPRMMRVVLEVVVGVVVTCVTSEGVEVAGAVAKRSRKFCRSLVSD